MKYYHRTSVSPDDVIAAAPRFFAGKLAPTVEENRRRRFSGTVGELTLKVSDLPQLERGERAVFFLEGEEPFQPHGRGRGLLRLTSEDRVEGNNATLGDVRGEIRSALAQGGR